MIIIIADMMMIKIIVIIKIGKEVVDGRLQGTKKGP